MTHPTTRRLLVTLALTAGLALPVAGAASAAEGTPGGRAAYAAQQESYLGQLQRAAVAGDPASGRSAYAAQQRDYTRSLADAARRPDAGGPGGGGDGVPLSVAALLAVGGVALGSAGAAVTRRRPVPSAGPLPARSRAMTA